MIFHGKLFPISERYQGLLNRMYYVYILKCADGTLYTGITNDLARRLQSHKEGTASKYTRAKGAVKIVYTEEHSTRSEALKREAQIKKFSREKKLNLIRT